MNKFLSYLTRIWDARPLLAKGWLECAEKYEEGLRANQSLDPQIVEFVLSERNRIRLLFSEVLPEFEDRISVVVTADALVENCAVFLWENRLYVLVSGALIGRPYDHPDDKGLKAWEWLVRHEAAHIRGNHLFWLFHTRRLFRMAYLIGCIPALFLGFFAPWLWLLGGFWLLQTIVGLVFEWKADLAATDSIKDRAALEEAEKSIQRMILQAIKRRPAPFGWIQYALSMVFVDPHPPFRARQWLLRRRLRYLAAKEAQLE